MTTTVSAEVAAPTRTPITSASRLPSETLSPNAATNPPTNSGAQQAKTKNPMKIASPAGPRSMLRSSALGQEWPTSASTPPPAAPVPAANRVASANRDAVAARRRCGPQTNRWRTTSRQATFIKAVATTRPPAQEMADSRACRALWQLSASASTRRVSRRGLPVATTIHKSPRGRGLTDRTYVR